MPEGPTIVLMKEDLQKFVGKKVIGTTGKANIDTVLLVDKTLKESRLYGKQTYLIFDEISYVGFEIPDDFVVGFGLDYNGLGRNLNDIYRAI